MALKKIKHAAETDLFAQICKWCVGGRKAADARRITISTEIDSIQKRLPSYLHFAPRILKMQTISLKCTSPIGSLAAAPALGTLARDSKDIPGAVG